MDYVPLASFDDFESPHAPPPAWHEPRLIWLLALGPMLPLSVAAIIGTGGGPALAIAFAIAIAVTLFGGVIVARFDQRALSERGQQSSPSPWMALVPAAYLVVRGTRRVLVPHRGNPLAPFWAHLALCALAAIAYYALGLAVMVLGGAELITRQ